MPPALCLKSFAILQKNPALSGFFFPIMIQVHMSVNPVNDNLSEEIRRFVYPVSEKSIIIL